MIEELQTLSDSGSPPDVRLKTRGAADNIYRELIRLDEYAAQRRAKETAMFDNAAPYSETHLRALGQSFRTNLNFGQAEELLDESLASYVDLLNSTQYLLTVRTKFRDADPHTVRGWEEIMAAEITRMLRKWTGFTHRLLLCANYFIRHGAGIAYYPNSYTWKWEVSRQGEVLVPRRSKTEEDDFELVAIIQDYEPQELWRRIKDPEIAAKKGWNVEEVKRVIKERPCLATENSTDWERWQEAARDCDLQLTSAGEMIRVVHMYVREFDGGISHFMFEESSSRTGSSRRPGSSDPGQFLFRHIREYESMDDFLALYVYGVGTTGHLQGVRGLGYKIMPQVQVSNRLQSQLIDGAMLSSSLMLRPSDASALKEAAMTYFGAFAILNPGFKVEPMSAPNFQNNTIPVLSQMQEMIRSKKTGYTPHNALPTSGPEMTKGQVTAILDNASSLSSISQLLFYAPEDRKYRALVKRIIWKGYSEGLDGGKEVALLKERIQEKGVPLEAFYALDPDETQAVRALGGGSKAYRSALVTKMVDYSPAMDPVGRRRTMRMAIAELVGWDRVDEFLEAPEVGRVSLDQQLAVVETLLMKKGEQVPVFENQIHLEHLKAHMEGINELVQSVQQGAALEDVVIGLSPLHEHSTQHIEFASGDPTSEEDLAMYRQALQQTGEIIINGARRLEKLRREGEAQAAQGEQGGAAEMNDSMERNAIELNMKLQTIQETAAIKNQIAIQKAQTDISIADAKAAAEIRRKAGLTAP